MKPELKNVTARDWVRALERDGFRAFKSRGSHHLYQHGDGRRVLVVYHKLGDTFGPKVVAQLLSATGWGEGDLRRLRLVR